MKTPVNEINSSIIVPANMASQPLNAEGAPAQPNRAPRAHIIDRRAARWARRATH